MVSFRDITENMHKNYDLIHNSSTNFLSKTVHSIDESFNIQKHSAFYNVFSKVSESVKALNEMFDNNKQLKVELLNIDEFIKTNELKEITNPVFFVRDGIPTSDGLLSNEIFGITKEQRAGTFAYIDLGATFITPLCYKVWMRMDSKIRNIVHETNTYRIDSEGKLVEDPNGKTGVKFLKDNFEKINLEKETSSRKRDIKIKFLNKAYKDGTMFITKYPIIPAYYRDVDTSRGRLQVGEINELYSALLNASRALKSSMEYGLNLSGSTRGRIQETLLGIYDWFSKEPQISKKYGIIKRAVLSKTTDYATRLVISAPDLSGEKLEDVMVDTDHCALPLASALVNFYPFIMYYLNTFFTSEFSGKFTYDVINSKGELETVELGDWQNTFSAMNIKKQVDRYIHGFSNRFIKVNVPVKKENKNKNVYLVFKGYKISKEEYEKSKGTGEPGELVQRPLTWCDLFYMAAVEATKDRCVLITRYPIDSCYNQYPSLVRVSSTKRTESMVVNNTLYTHYPYIRSEMIGTNTSNMFVDTLQVANPMLVVMGGDYDGDQVTVKGVFYNESNKELKDYINSKRQFISFNGTNMREADKLGFQAIYNLTLAMPSTKLTPSEDIKLG